MTISTPQLISASAKIEESVIVRAGNDSYIFAVKNHRGSPLREIEVITVAGAQAALSGPNFFNIRPVRIEVLDQVFRFVSAITLSGSTVRFYWNQIAGRQTGDNPILTVDYDTISNQIISSYQTLPFEGLDPLVMDGRTTDNPLRLYMLFITEDGNVSVRISNDLGVTWSAGSETCLFGEDVLFVESAWLDYNEAKENIRAVLRETTPDSTNDVFLVDISLSPVAVQTGKKLYPYFRRPIRICCDGQDKQRFKFMYPLVRRRNTSGGESPC